MTMIWLWIFLSVVYAALVGLTLALHRSLKRSVEWHDQRRTALDAERDRLRNQDIGWLAMVSANGIEDPLHRLASLLQVRRAILVLEPIAESDSILMDPLYQEILECLSEDRIPLPLLVQHALEMCPSQEARSCITRGLEDSGFHAGQATSREDPSLRRLIRTALRSLNGTTRVDPIETDYASQAALIDVEDDLAKSFPDGLNGLGQIHVLWALKQRLLHEKHGLEWKSPMEMNPGTLYD